MPKVTKKKVTENSQADQPTVITTDKIDESTSKKGVKRKATSEVEEVKKLPVEILNDLKNWILECKKGSNK